jgi:hypothetical protein
MQAKGREQSQALVKNCVSYYRTLNLCKRPRWMSTPLSARYNLNDTLTLYDAIFLGEAKTGVNTPAGDGKFLGAC